ncbi:hypothetical protein Hanom_Chr08g00683791 [Helianthus anomalus]
MKKTMPWNDDDSSSNESSSSDSNASDNGQIPKRSKMVSGVKLTNRMSKGIDFDALSQHGYKGRLSVLKVPAPKENDKNRDWSLNIMILIVYNLLLT